MSQKKIVVVGGGPAGLEVSRLLLKKGYEAHVYEKLKELGGLYIFGVPDWRIDKKRIREKIDELKEIGLVIHTGVEIGKDIDLMELVERYDAVILATGAWKPKLAKWEGVNLKGVIHAFDYLTRINLFERGYLAKDELLEARGKTFVVGGGDVAMDAAREAKRRGADVVILYRRSESEMPCGKKEVEDAKKDEIDIICLTNVRRFVGEEGRLKKIIAIKMKLGEPDESGRPRPIPIEGSEFELEADTCILATGEIPTPPFEDEKYGMKLTSRGSVVTDNKWRTTRKGVFAIGDLATGPLNFGSAIKSAIECAESVGEYLKTGEWPKS